MSLLIVSGSFRAAAAARSGIGSRGVSRKFFRHVQAPARHHARITRRDGLPEGNDIPSNIGYATANSHVMMSCAVCASSPVGCRLGGRMFQAEVGARLDADTTFFVRETEIDVTQKLFSKNMRHGANPEDGLRLYPGNSTRCPQLSGCDVVQPDGGSRWRVAGTNH